MNWLLKVTFEWYHICHKKISMAVTKVPILTG
jgi:hypothetical protein